MPLETIFQARRVNENPLFMRQRWSWERTKTSFKLASDREYFMRCSRRFLHCMSTGSPLDYNAIKRRLRAKIQVSPSMAPKHKPRAILRSQKLFGFVVIYHFLSFSFSRSIHFHFHGILWNMKRADKSDEFLGVKGNVLRDGNIGLATRI